MIFLVGAVNHFSCFACKDLFFWGGFFPIFNVLKAAAWADFSHLTWSNVKTLKAKKPRDRLCNCSFPHNYSLKASATTGKWNSEFQRFEFQSNNINSEKCPFHPHCKTAFLCDSNVSFFIKMELSHNHAQQIKCWVSLNRPLPKGINFVGF